MEQLDCYGVKKVLMVVSGCSHLDYQTVCLETSFMNFLDCLENGTMGNTWKKEAFHCGPWTIALWHICSIYMHEMTSASAAVEWAIIVRYMKSTFTPKARPIAYVGHDLLKIYVVFCYTFYSPS
ncbi:hypothetical protein XELAEV_18042884mg [Xenopus laevis]|uniref:Uncharacterized protein n=1 Tax=Xenopus laevis TaxID=8355 RepID=A0A974C670_XENLA|nr:hypothetical protein XELAEV_18042884mg [Xenopus laevis]